MNLKVERVDGGNVHGRILLREIFGSNDLFDVNHRWSSPSFLCVIIGFTLRRRWPAGPQRMPRTVWWY